MNDTRGEPPDRAVEVDRIRRLFGFFTATRGPDRSRVYATVSPAVANDAGLLDLLLDTPSEQRRPSLLFAAVNLLLAAHPEAELAAYYPIHGGRRPVDEHLVPAFAGFCAEHRAELARVLRERSTQTNEIRRCIALRLGLGHVGRRWPGPFALVEAGASAGLNLRFDHYGYRLGGRAASTSDASSIILSCEVRGAAEDAILGDAPPIASRLGIDQHPIDLSDPDARAWLEAFIWPEQTEDLGTLREAVDLAAAGPEVIMTAGDATTDTARILAELPGDQAVVVFTASLLSYLSTEARSAFVAQLQQASRSRPVAWVFAEAPGLLAATDLTIPALRGPVAQRNELYLVGADLRGPGGRRDDRLLALADPYLRWLAPARGDADDFAWLPADTR